MIKTASELIEYYKGYITGITEGDGTISLTPGDWPYRKKQRYWRLALKDVLILKRTRQYLRRLGIRLEIKCFATGIYKLETRKLEILEKIKWVLYYNPTRYFQLGYLSGIFDAEGNWHLSNLRIYNSNPEIIRKVLIYSKTWGFEFKEENYKSKKGNGLRLVGNKYEKIRFLSSIQSIKSMYYFRKLWEET